MGLIYSHAQKALVWLGNDSAIAKNFADLSHQQVQVASRIPVVSQGFLQHLNGLVLMLAANKLARILNRLGHKSHKRSR
jgi:hypothetical protein